jgi:hypothetical protein
MIGITDSPEAARAKVPRESLGLHKSWLIYPVSRRPIP